MSTYRFLPTTIVVLLISSIGCSRPTPDLPSQPESGRTDLRADVGQPASLDQLPDPDLSQMDPKVTRQLSDARRAVVEDWSLGLKGAELGQAIGNLAMLYHAYDLLSPAQASYNLARAIDIHGYRWSYYSGMVAQRQGRYDDALSSLTTASERLQTTDPNASDIATAISWRKGQVLRQLNRGAEAEAQLRLAAKNATRCPAALFDLGQLALNEDRPDEAIEYFERTLRLQKDAEQVFFPLGQALRQVGRDEEARSYLERSARREKSIGGRATCVDPLDTRLGELTTGAAAFITRGQHARFAGDLDSAIEDFRRAVEIADDDPIAHQALAKGLAEAGDLNSAIEHFQRAVQLDTESPSLANDLATLLIRAKRFPEARSLLADIQARHPDFLPSQLTLAHLQHLQNAPQDALERVDRVLALQPTSSRARGLRAQILLALGRRADALKEMTLLLDEHPPSDAAERLRLAGALAQLGSSATAQRHLQDLINDPSVSDPIKARAHMNLAGLALQIADRAAAQHHLQSASALDPEFQPAREALKQLGPVP